MIWKPKRTCRPSRKLSPDVNRRAPRPQRLERRELLAADPIHVGVVYLETDYLESDNDFGSDSRGDRFLLTFSGGAPDSTLNQLRIQTDKDGDGLSVGDPIFDTQLGGRGKGGAHGFQIISIQTGDGRTATAEAMVADGGQELIVNLQNFRAGDRLEFTLDVDEVLRNSLDLAVFNDRLDVITSGQEFQDSILEAVFEAPHYESASADAIFLNDYGSPHLEHGLNLPPDEGSGIDSRPNRSAAAIGSTLQSPKPVAISGYVWLDDNLDALWQDSEAGLADVELTLLSAGIGGQYFDTGLRARTDANGRYEFSRSLGLQPGDFQITQTQPDGLFSVAAVPGSVDGVVSGVATNVNVLSAIQIPLGDMEAMEMNFAEAAPASVSGFVYSDQNNNGIRESGESAISGVTLRLNPVDTIAAQQSMTAISDASGAYSFDGLVPGAYEIIQVDQPSDYVDGLDAAGTIRNIVVGVADNPGDRIRDVQLGGGDVGLEYNFGELPLGEISGFVYLAAPGEDCVGIHAPDSEQPLGGVLVELQTPQGNLVSRVTTTPMGQYSFESVPPGTYHIVQYTPAELLDGRSHVGTIDEVQNGDSANGSLIRQITMSPGGVGVEYNFCEIAPAAVSGYVYHDHSNEGNRDDDEDGIANVTLSLVDQSGGVVATTITDADGRYEFSGLQPGTYQLREQQPAGYLDGINSVGRIGADRVGNVADDSIRQIELRQGLLGEEYNFGELLPASLSGSVHVDLDGDCIQDEDESGLGDVVIRLFDDKGNEVASMLSNDDGIYRFSNLIPGRYTIIQEQPQGYFDGGTKSGSEGGLVGENRVTQIDLGSGTDATDYDFCERPPASLSGTVHLDLDGDCVQDPDEQGIQGVSIELRDASGALVATTRTDADGNYFFDGLASGEYTVSEIQPDDYFDGAAKAGSEGGRSGINRISEIQLIAGNDATDYDFCEEPPASLSGAVYLDTDGDCIQDPNEEGIEGVTIELRNATGTRIATTLTDAGGQYRFDRLRGGDYTIHEVQPEGFLHGGQTLGSSGGMILGVDLMSVSLKPGEAAVDYLFCEYRPGSISGTVWSDNNQDQIRDPDEDPISEVTIKLVDEHGVIIKTTKTDVQGGYRFDGLYRGVYEVYQEQPENYFHGGQLVGDQGGSTAGHDVLAGIQISSGVVATDYDFPEVPSATLSGYVFIDGLPIESEDPIAANEVRQYRDGIFTSDDTPIQGVRIEIRDDQGKPLSDDAFLPGASIEPTIAFTDATGFYIFRGLRPGTYTIYQSQPDGLIDSIDTAGSTGGLPVNATDQYDITQEALIASIDATETFDVLLMVPGLAGIDSVSNNFSEIQVNLVAPRPVEGGFLPEPERVFETVEQPLPDRFDSKMIRFGDWERTDVPRSRILGDVDVVTWHLSVINGGYPKGAIVQGSRYREVAMKEMKENWSEGENSEGQWKLLNMQGEVIEQSKQMTLGAQDAVALVGDFDGDGDDEAAIYVAGQWYVDLNGNGIWDAGDLWILLGTGMDRPVVGDWDGDGKDDIGIYGRKWEQDLRRMKLEAGLPDPSNRSRKFLENRKTLGLVSVKLHENDRGRSLRRGNRGELRTDAVDHVFQFGEHADTPVSGDWNGDSIDQIGIFRAGTWVLDAEGDGRRKHGEVTFEFGRPGDQPIVGDFDGDGIDEVGVIRGNQWIIDSDGDRKLTANDRRIDLPANGTNTQPLVGDWDGDGKDEPGFYDQAG